MKKVVAHSSLPVICPVDVPVAPCVKVTVAPALPPKMKTSLMVLLLATVVRANPTAMMEWMVPEGTAPAPETLMVGCELPARLTLQLKLTAPWKVLFAGMVTRVPVVVLLAPTMSAEAGADWDVLVTQGLVP